MLLAKNEYLNIYIYIQVRYRILFVTNQSYCIGGTKMKRFVYHKSHDVLYFALIQDWLIRPGRESKNLREMLGQTYYIISNDAQLI